MLSNYYVPGGVLGKIRDGSALKILSLVGGRWGWWQTHMKRRMLMMCKCTFMKKRASLVTGLAGIKAGGVWVSLWTYGIIRARSAR